VCGIFGFYLNDSQVTEQVLSDLEIGLDEIRHRGPDGSGVWASVNGNVGLGHVRLSIIDIEDGHQPMHSGQDDRFSVIFNGEIYNYIELRKELGESNFKTASDTEVVLKSFEKWGVKCVEHFRGMFSIVIYDSLKQTLFIARDRFGIKPLYWTKTTKGIYFASEIKALLPFLDERRVNNSALSDYFSFQFYLNGKVLVDEINEFPAAHYALVSQDCEVIEKRYWEVEYNIDYSHNEKWFVERLRGLVDDSVKMHMRSDVEVGSYVSGGVDSSLLASLASDLHPDRRMQGFNGRFQDNINFDESRHAQCLAKERDLDLHINTITEDDFVDNIEKIIWHLDQPVAGPGSFPQYMVSKKVSEHVKVVLGGQGGDEIFGGYARYLVAYFEQCIKGALEGTLNNGNYVVSYESIIPNLQSLLQYKPMLREFWSDGLFAERDHRYWRLINRANTMRGIINEDAINNEASFSDFKKIFWGKNIGKEAYFDSMTHFDFKTLLPALLQVEDRMSMAHGVEARVPFLDHPLIEFAATIPADIKFKNGELKRLLKYSFKGHLPNQILDRKDKMGFPVPLNLWLENGGRARDYIGDVLGSKKARSRGYLADKISIDKVLDSQSIYGRNLWALLSLELWHQQFID
jgi:asparagine synthase (glutamine-hydrolysing)